MTYGYSVALHLMSLEYSKYNNYDLVNVNEHDASEEALTNYFLVDYFTDMGFMIILLLDLCRFFTPLIFACLL